MRTRAVAVASERSNAIGAVELECTPLGLVIVHLGVGAFQEGYAPGAVTHGTRVVVPWPQVLEASIDADRIFVRIDETLTPHSRLMLGGFSLGDPPDPAELRRQRLIVRLGTGGAMLVAGLLVAMTFARVSADAGAAAAVLLGCLTAGVVLFVGMVAEHRLGLGGHESEGVRLAFAMQLAIYVPSLARALEAGVRPGRGQPLPPVALPSFQSLLPRTTTAVVITMSAALLGAVLTAAWVSRAPARAARERAERDDAPARPAADPTVSPEPASAAALLSTPRPLDPSTPPARALPPAPPPSAGDTAALSGSCRCRRADSLLWRNGIPRMSLILIDKKPRQHHGHPHLDIEIGVVNNWDQPIPEVSLLVQFYEKDPPPSSKRTPTFDRPLYFEGPLDPGQALKWHVDARGDDFEVTAPRETMLEEAGTDFAPTNLIAELLHANHRPIRLHGAMLLGYLGDPRAKEGALGLREALREDEAPYIDRLTWALSDVRTCGVDVKGTGTARTLRACVFNASKAPRDHLGMRTRALDRPFRYDTPLEAPPLVVAERAFHLTGQLAPEQGAYVDVALDTTNPDGVAAEAFEAYADREEVLF